MCMIDHYKVLNLTAAQLEITESLTSGKSSEHALNMLYQVQPRGTAKEHYDGEGRVPSGTYAKTC
jgi:hypothetical protein